MAFPTGTNIPSTESPTRLGVLTTENGNGKGSRKNIYAQRLLEFPKVVVLDLQARGFCGRWRSMFPAGEFGTHAPLHVEIGCNAGHALLENARLHPAICHVGMDLKAKQLYRAAIRASAAKLGNILFVQGDARCLDSYFAPSEINKLELFFPDPWPKNKQKKHRLVHVKWLEMAHRVLKTGGMLHMKTDHEEYFEWMLKSARAIRNNFTWEIISLSRNLHQAHPDPKKLDFPNVTLFEKVFIRLGLPICELMLKKPEAGWLFPHDG